MSIVIYEKLSKTEVKNFRIDFGASLITGEAISSVTSVHTPPSGAATNPDESFSATIVIVKVGPLSVLGTHFVDIQVVGSLGSKPEVRLAIAVDW